MEEGLVELALGEGADVRAGRERLVGPADHDAADVRVGVEAIELGGQSLHDLRAKRVADLRPVDPNERHPPVDRRLDGVGHLYAELTGVIAFTPVASRAMISFWICEVPSYSVVTRASRR
jgi:hypothetical protein